MILVTGANGHLGSMAIDHFLKKKPDADITGLVRSEEKGEDLKTKGVEIRIGDYFDTDSLEKTFDGMDVLAFISSGTLKDRMEQHKNVVETAKKTGFQQIFYTSVVKAEERLSPLTFDHNETEKIIKESGIPYTFCRNTIYLEFFPMFWGDALKPANGYFPEAAINRISHFVRRWLKLWQLLLPNLETIKIRYSILHPLNHTPLRNLPRP